MPIYRTAAVLAAALLATSRAAAAQADPHADAAAALQQCMADARAGTELPALGIARRAPRTPLADARTPLFDDLALLVGSRAEKGRVRLSVDANGTVAHAAREPLAQAMLNLLLNALAHAPEGTAVELRARHSDAGADITVRDHGPGIAASELERIWEPFYSGGSGTGLGFGRRPPPGPRARVGGGGGERGGWRRGVPAAGAGAGW
jgi:signal transduction histidine kinase